ncbi:SDR family oxidoreductase [Microvirga roseola]|uniref:SDR family oxidoreductase n=1 Tax=Microvirga roseola TaxID=2883126 RepID=UPI001E33FA70|nr:SDR family oxidoreductase [Microvirga roseola]
MNKRKVALVTGANRGIGLEIARQLAEHEFHVLLGARSLEAAQDATEALRANALQASSLHVDLNDKATLISTADEVERLFGHLDCLVNNASICLDAGRVSKGSMLEIFRDTYETNVFGLFTLTEIMLPNLKKSCAANVVNMSSAVGSLAIWGNKELLRAHNLRPTFAYCSSKTAVNALTVLMAEAYAEFGIKVNAACPGLVSTRMNGYSGARTPEEGARIAVKLATLPADGPTGGFYNDEGRLPW